MTIAIGLQVGRGIVVAADTLVSRRDGSTTEENKITAFVGESGLYIIANASNDLNATKTVVNSIVATLEKTTLANIGDLQSVMSQEMVTWYGKLTAEQTSQFVFAAKLNGDEPRLYYCEPPSTFLPINNGYIAAGVGASITDPLKNMLFRSTGYTDVQETDRLFDVQGQEGQHILWEEDHMRNPWI